MSLEDEVPNPARSGQVRTRDGRTLVNAQLTQVTGPDSNVVAMHRADLIDALASAVPGTVRVGEQVTDLHPDGRVSTGCGVSTFDLVVAADGVHSTIRRTWTPTRVFAGAGSERSRRRPELPRRC